MIPFSSFRSSFLLGILVLGVSACHHRASSSGLGFPFIGHTRPQVEAKLKAVYPKFIEHAGLGDSFHEQVIYELEPETYLTAHYRFNGEEKKWFLTGWEGRSHVKVE